MNRKDWLLLVIAAAKGERLSPVQLQKTVFLLGKEQPEAVGQDFYDFVPYAYGPFCVDVYRDAKELSQEGFVAIKPGQYGHWREYRITPAGMKHAEELSHTNLKVVGYLEKKVRWAKSQNFRSLVKKTYDDYPEYKVNSVFQG